MESRRTRPRGIKTPFSRARDVNYFDDNAWRPDGSWPIPICCIPYTCHPCYIHIKLSEYLCTLLANGVYTYSLVARDEYIINIWCTFVGFVFYFTPYRYNVVVGNKTIRPMVSSDTRNARMPTFVRCLYGRRRKFDCHINRWTYSTVRGVITNLLPKPYETNTFWIPIVGYNERVEITRREFRSNSIPFFRQLYLTSCFVVTSVFSSI